MCDGECSVCLEPTPHALQPCAHAMCPACARAWFARDRCRTCPVCRQLVVELAFDAESPDDVIRVDFPREACHAGITFANHARGVRVLRVDARDRAAACGIRAGHVLSHINGIAVQDHIMAAAVTDRATEARYPLVYTLVRGQPMLPWPVWWRTGSDS